MSDLIRIAPGTITAYALLTTDSYLVSNWTRVSDMGIADEWSATQTDNPMLQEHVPSLEVGAGGFYGKHSGIITFSLLTPLMRDYLENTLLGGNGIAAVTAYLHSPRIGDNNGFAVFQGEMISPYAVNAESSFRRFSDHYYTANDYIFRRGRLVTVSYLLLESGDYLLLETGDKLALEQQ